MFEALKDIACFVTAFVSFLYGTRVAWGSGKTCQFSEDPTVRLQSLRKSIPMAAIIYFCGFLIIFSYAFSDYLAWTVFALTSAIILAALVVSMAMPELRRKSPSKDLVHAEDLVLAELRDGSSCRIGWKTLNVFLSNDKVAKFKRSDGWVLVDKDPLRGQSHGTHYSGVERRRAA